MQGTRPVSCGRRAKGSAQLTIRAAKAACDKCPGEPQALSLDSNCHGMCWWRLTLPAPSPEGSTSKGRTRWYLS